MEIEKIVLKAGSKLPESCRECGLSMGSTVHENRGYCRVHGRSIIDDITQLRPSWCPLQVEDEEVCIWRHEKSVDDNYKYFVIQSCRPNVRMWTNILRGRKFCPNCGRRIKYEEEE